MKTLSILACLASSGCLADRSIGSESSKLGVVEVYERTFTWDAPMPCEVLLHRRVYDELARIITYDAQLAGRELSITYSIEESAPLPLVIELADVGAPPTLLRSSQDALVSLTPSGDVALEVDDYVAGPGTATRGVPAPVSAEALALVGCALPMRAELGYVPGFIRNRRGAIEPGGDGVAGSSSHADPLLAGWDVPPLAAWLRQGMCLTKRADELDWECGCYHVDDPLTGVVTGECEP